MDVIVYLFNLLLVNPMTNALIVLTNVLFGNFALAIIAFTIVIRGATWPLTRAQLKASRAMSTLQPKVQEIQKKYKDPKRRSEETMKLYREEGVNPAGCLLPMLIQFPIWIGLYQTIRFTLGGTPESLIDLSQRLYPWSYIRNAVPLQNTFLWLHLGQPDVSLILPIIVGASMWVQQRMVTPQATDERQQSMNRMMLWMMPLMFAWFSMTVPSGLALYWAATSVVGIFMQYFYMGRRLDWKTLFTMPGAQPAPQAPRQQRASGPEAEEAEEDQELVSAAVGGSSSKKRKKRRGRRRGKR
jgi:YidC/Oxa1 family membrane protein insertase